MSLPEGGPQRKKQLAVPWFKHFGRRLFLCARSAHLLADLFFRANAV